MSTPVEPGAPAKADAAQRGPLARLYAALVSPRLAIALLVAVLACCIAGVTVVRGERAGELIFSTLWFNGLLVLLALSAGAAFFTRIWRRKLTLVSVGMILFHLSFMALLGGVVVNGLFHFQGALRLTEGETLPNGRPESYDRIDAGRFFDFARLRGETTLIRMHREYSVGGANKRAAYEIAVGEGEQKRQHVIYVTEFFDDGGVRYFCSQEGYSVLVILTDALGREIHGIHVPLQSIRQADGSRLYATGTATQAGSFPFPQPPEEPRLELLVTYWPSAEDRAGQVGFRAALPGAAPPTGVAVAPGGGPPAGETGLVPVGGIYRVGDLRLEPREIRYWVSMDVRYDPGLGFSLGSLVTGLLGMFLTLVGRLRQGPRRKSA